MLGLMDLALWTLADSRQRTMTVKSPRNLAESIFSAEAVALGDLGG